MGEKFDGAGYPFGAGCGDVTPVAAVMFGGMAYVLSFNTVRCPRPAYLRGFVDKYLCARWSQRCPIEVEGTIHMGFG